MYVKNIVTELTNVPQISLHTVHKQTFYSGSPAGFFTQFFSKMLRCIYEGSSPLIAITFDVIATFYDQYYVHMTRSNMSAL